MAYNKSLKEEKEKKEKEIELGYSPIMVTTSSIELSNPVQQPEVSDVTDSSDNVIPVSASCVPVNPSTLSSDGFELQDQEIIPSENITGSFTPGKNLVEFFVYDADKNLSSVNYNFTNWTTGEKPGNELLSGSAEEPPTSSVTNAISLDPALNAYNLGFDTGQVFTSYNFINYELGSSIEETFYISEISGDRTEIAIKSNFISSSVALSGCLSLKNQLETSTNFDEFYISLFNNEYQIAINIDTVAGDNDDFTILIKLYDALPPQFSTKDELYVVTKVGESVAYKINFADDIQTFVDNANYIKGPNINISLQDLVNNSTTLKSREDLLNTNATSSLNNVLNILNQRGVAITPNYSYDTYNEFVNFSSAKERVNNFYEKVSQIQAYEADIASIQSTVAGNPAVSAISQSLASLQTNITNLIANFDGYETYLYYNTSSLYAYPKNTGSGTTYPYDLLDTGSVEVLTWLGSDVENDQYFGGIINSASLYDEGNQNWLYYTIPQYIVDNSDNTNYLTFANMVGQSFDEVWIYTKALSERYNTTNDPDSGLPLDLAADAIEGLGFQTFGNNYDNQDNFIGLAGYNDGVYTPPTGSELITKYVAVNSGSIINYWDPGYSWEDYVESVTEAAFPYAIDKVSKEIYKRLYHNMAYLTKKKGTISGLRQLINIWGIPNTILRINEFGGKNRDNSNDYDLWYNRFSYAYTPVATQYIASSSVLVPWQPLYRNYLADINEAGDNEFILPDGVGVRFKTTGFPSSSYAGTFYSQSILAKKSNTTKNSAVDWAISLQYDNQPSGSYSGSSFSDYYEYGNLSFFLSGSESEGGTIQSEKIYLPFFNRGWWTVLLQRDTHASASNNSANVTYTLYAANNQYNGADGNTIGWTGSVSVSLNTPGASQSLNESWNKFSTGVNDGVYIGGYVSGSNVGVVKSGSGGTNGFQAITNGTGKIFSGSFQEFRYYSHAIGEEVFYDFVMNPESVEGNSITGSQSSFDIVNFRAPLGNELEQLYTASASTGSYTGYAETLISSSHPAVTGSAPSVITASFINPSNFSTTSSYKWIVYDNANTRTYSKPNYEVYQLDQPAIGIRNRVSNKIQNESGDAYGNVLSRQISIDQNYLISQSYTEDTNNLEVGFSPQDEVNDDIIATYGYGVISDAIADPRFVTSSDSYYPKLRETAEDYFKKYTQGNVWDYLRLIKYFDNSLFKAIKSYVPARTSVTTGVIIKQHMLERNRRPAIQITPNTTIAYGVSGSVNASSADTGAIYGTGVYGTGVYGTEGTDTSWGANTLNVPQIFQNLELNANIPLGSYSGTIQTFTGGPAFYSPPVDFTYFTQSGTVSISGSTSQIPLSNSGSFFYSSSTATETSAENFIDNFIQTGFQMTGSATRVTMDLNNVYLESQESTGLEKYTPGSCFLRTTKHIKSKVQWDLSRTPNGSDVGVRFQITSSERGIIFNRFKEFPNPSTITYTSSYMEFFPGEQLFFNFDGGDGTSYSNTFLRFGDLKDENSGSIGKYIGDEVSQQGWFEKNETISGSVLEWNGYQDQFYNGEYSGSVITAATQSLLNNPFALAPPPDTTYHLIIDQDNGLTSPITTTELFGMRMLVFQYESAEKALNLDTGSGGLADAFSPYMNTQYTGAIAIKQASVGGGVNHYIYMMIMPMRVIKNPNGSPQSSDLAANSGEFRSDLLVPFPSIGDNLDETQAYSTWTDPEITSTGEFEYGFNQTNPLIKWNQMPISNPSTGGKTWQFLVTGLLGNLNSGILHSGYFGRTRIVERFFGDSTSLTSNPPAGTETFVTYQFPNAESNKARVIRLEATDGTAPGNTTSGTSFVDIVCNGTGAQRGVNLPFNFSRFATKQQNFLNTIATASYGPGTGSLFFLGTSFTSSYFHDIGNWVPSALVFNKNSIDAQGNLVNNESTLLNPNVNFSFDLNVSQSGRPFVDRTGNLGSKFIQNLNEIGGVISSDDNSMVGFSYVANSMGRNGTRALSGSAYGYVSTAVSAMNLDGAGAGFSVGQTYTTINNNVTPSPASTGVVIRVDTVVGSGGIATFTIIDGGSGNTNGDEITTNKGSSEASFTVSGIATAENGIYSSSFANSQLISFDPTAPDETSFYNTAFNPLINNASSSVKNTYIMKVEYDDGEAIPSNILPIANRTAEKAQVPDSNYTTTRIINPRYDGTEIFSADYNFYTAPSASFLYLNDISGSSVSESSQQIEVGGISITSSAYPGDVSYGNQAVINKNPIYFARFVSSKDNRELDGTYTFRINQLIECPTSPILGTKAPENPIVINIDGSNINLTDVTSTFEAGRKASVAYDEGSIQYSASVADLGILKKGDTVNYTALKVGDSKIYQGGLEYNTLITNQNTPEKTVPTMSFSTASFLSLAGPGYLAGVASTGDTSYGQFSGPVVSKGCPSWLEASQSLFRLGGDLFRITGSAGVTGTGNQYITGPVLGLMHSFNQRVNKGLIANNNQASTLDQRFGIPAGVKTFDTSSNINYFTFNFSESVSANGGQGTAAIGLGEYENFNLPFLIQKNDEIRVTYSTGSTTQKILQTQDFTVTSVPTSSINTNYRALSSAAVFGSANKINIYDEIHVHPDPLNFNFVNNRIYNFTIRRRVNADDRVIIYQSAPANSRGVNTITPSGYLIPGDFSPTQNRNVLTLINQLKAKNANPAPTIAQAKGPRPVD